MALVVVPVLLFVSWRGWIRSIRVVLPAWRNGLVLTALLMISINWMVALLLDAPQLLHVPLALPDRIGWAVYLLAHPVGIVAVILTFALRHEARLTAILAGVLLVLCWPSGYSLSGFFNGQY